AELFKQRLDARQHGPGLLAMFTRADGQVHIGCRDAEVSEEHVRHLLVIVLACVHHDMLRSPFHGVCDRGQLHELRACTHDTQDSHPRTLPFRFTGERRGASSNAYRSFAATMKRSGPSEAAMPRMSRVRTVSGC